MIPLKYALEAALVDILANREIGFDPAGSLEVENWFVLSLWELSKDSDMSLSSARRGCEACIDCARQADDANKIDCANLFRGIVRTVSPIIARKAI